MSTKIMAARNGVTDITKAIDGMRLSRDRKLADIDRFQNMIQEWNQNLTTMLAERQRLDAQAELQNASMGDTYKAVKHNYTTKTASIDKLRSQLELIEKDTAIKLKDIDTSNTQLQVWTTFLCQVLWHSPL